MRGMCTFRHINILDNITMMAKAEISARHSARVRIISELSGFRAFARILAISALFPGACPVAVF